jgi:hypothetical protein
VVPQFGRWPLFFYFAIYFSLCRVISCCLVTDFVVTYTTNVHRQHAQFSLFSPTECNSGSWVVISYGKCRREELVSAQLMKLFIFIIRNVIQTHQLKWHCSIAGRCLGVCNANILLLSDMC